MHAPDGPLMMGTPTCPFRRSSPRHPPGLRLVPCLPAAASRCPGTGTRITRVRTACRLPPPPPLSFRRAPRIPSPPPRAVCCARSTRQAPPLLDATPQSPLATSPPSIHESACPLSLTCGCGCGGGAQGRTITSSCRRLAVKRARKKRASERPHATTHESDRRIGRCGGPSSGRRPARRDLHLHQRRTPRPVAR